jgi:hypothetical protein
MPYHPSLKEVLEKDNSHADEWAEFTVEGIGWSVWVSAERVIGAQPKPEYGFSCSALSSEFGSFYFANVFVNFEITSEENLAELKGDSMPLGAFSYYSENEGIVSLSITSEVYKDIISLVGSGIGKFTVRVSVPKWDDSECKCVPITQYQLIFNSQKNEIKEESTESDLLGNLHLALNGISDLLDKLYRKSLFSWSWLAGGIVLGFILAKLL